MLLEDGAADAMNLPMHLWASLLVIALAGAAAGGSTYLATLWFSEREYMLSFATYGIALFALLLIVYFILRKLVEKRMSDNKKIMMTAFVTFFAATLITLSGSIALVAFLEGWDPLVPTGIVSGVFFLYGLLFIANRYITLREPFVTFAGALFLPMSVLRLTLNRGRNLVVAERAQDEEMCGVPDEFEFPPVRRNQD